MRSDSLSYSETFRASSFSEKMALVLSTWFGSGLVPFASGTCGTLAAVPLIFLLDSLGTIHTVVIVLIAAAIAVWSSDRTRHLLGKKDPSEVVIDEVAGFLLTMALVPHTWPAICLAFALFRFFDIFKPYPIKHLEMLRGGLGIVADDLLAGLYAGAGTWIILFTVQAWTKPG